MPSQEDYLNGLLNGMSEDDDNPANGTAPDLDALAGMSEEQIAMLLAEGEAGRQSSVKEKPAGDVLDLDSADSDVEEIQELLKKSDRNESVGSLEETGKEENPADRLMADIERAGETEAAEKAADTRKEKALEKKRLKAEKKAAREAAKAEKRQQRRAKKSGGKEVPHSESEEPLREKEADTVREYDMVQDRELLDSIVAEAGKVEHAEREEAPQVNLMEVAAALEAERNVDISQEVPYMEEDMASGTDMDSGVLAVGLDEVDDYIPEIDESVREKEPKKKGRMSKFMDFLMEEEEEPENEDLPISDENQEIIREMDGEEAQKAKKKVQKKAKKKEKKKEKKKKEAKPKKAKAPKPKKEKRPKEADPYPGRKLSFKKVLPIVLLGISVGAVLFIFVNLSADFTNKQAARTAFANGDYQTCYTNLYGKKLNESDEQMFNKSECILHIRMWYREYEYLVSQGSELQALDSLIQSVHDYPEFFQYAFRWDAGVEVNQIYNDILDVLYGKYGVTEVEAQEIGALKSDIDYTRAVVNLLGDAGYGEETVPAEELPSVDSGSEGADMQPPDELPEEEGLGSGDYVDNQ